MSIGPAIDAAGGSGAALERLARQDWGAARTALDAQGWAILEGLLDESECDGLARLYPEEQHFRSHVHMARHGFGKGEYRYFRYPLPDPVGTLRSAIYPALAPIANDWNARMGIDARFPECHTAFLEQCHAAGQTRPTPLLLQYGQGDYNCLHQDLYGEQVFPLQVAVLLSEPEVQFTGGEFVITEQRPRMQSRADVVPLRRGDALVFAVNNRPVQGTAALTASFCATVSAG